MQEKFAFTAQIVYINLLYYSIYIEHVNSELKKQQGRSRKKKLKCFSVEGGVYTRLYSSLMDCEQMKHKNRTFRIDGESK